MFVAGVALGARLSESHLSRLTEFLFTFVYSMSAPLGIAIGIAIRHSYVASGATANLIQGSFDAVSAGILLYVGYTQLLAYDFPIDYSKCGNNKYRKTGLFLSMWSGDIVMAIIGKYL